MAYGRRQAGGGDKNYLTLKDNEIRNARHGIYGSNYERYLLIERCIVHGCSSNGMYLIGGGPTLAQRPILRNNLVYGNSGWGIYGGANMYYTLMENVTVSGNGAGLYGFDTNLNVMNSIVCHNTRTNVHSGVTNTYIMHCDIEGWIRGGTGNIALPPLFKNSAAGNYRLQSGSPCVNAGTNQLWMDDGIDLDWWKRIRNEIVDMGAYEFFAAGTCLTVR